MDGYKVLLALVGVVMFALGVAGVIWFLVENDSVDLPVVEEELVKHVPDGLDVDIFHYKDCDVQGDGISYRWLEGRDAISLTGPKEANADVTVRFIYPDRRYADKKFYRGSGEDRNELDVSDLPSGTDIHMLFMWYTSSSYTVRCQKQYISLDNSMVGE